MSGKKGMQHYSVEIKQTAIQLFLEEGCTYREIAERLGMRKKERIKIWVRDYRREGMTGLTRPIGRPQKQSESEQGEIERLRMENALLKKLQSELRKDMLAKRDIGRSITTRKNSR